MNAPTSVGSGGAVVTDIDQVRAIADAVLYEGYLLYPYRASSSKNQSRWQFGVLGPPHAEPEAFGEEPEMSMQCLLERTGAGSAVVETRLRFLQLQTRSVERVSADGYEPVDELVVDGTSLLSWQEAVEQELLLPTYDLGSTLDAAQGTSLESVLHVPGGEEVEEVIDGSGAMVGRVVRHRSPLVVAVQVAATPDDTLARLSVGVRNSHPEVASTKDEAIRLSLIGAHLVIRALAGARFVSLLEPPAQAAAAAGRCHQRRCYPVLVGPPGSADTVLGSPIILYDHPEIAAESAGALFDSTEIDEILTLRVMTMTDAEKDEARATDPKAAQIIDRCDAMPPDSLQALHGVLRDPHGPLGSARSQSAGSVAGWADVRNAEPPSFETGDVPWWDPAADQSVQPELDSVVIRGVSVHKGSLVRVHPSRRADAQDLFFADQVAKVTAVLSDVDGGTHVALVLVDDPAADLHEWYGRYFYFAPDELEPLGPDDPGVPASEHAHDQQHLAPEAQDPAREESHR